MAKKKVTKKTSIYRGETNPFNVKINRTKHAVINQKVKGTKGLPGTSPAISHEKRKKLWHKTRIAATKANKYVDKRFINESMASEEHMTNRLIMERKKKIKKNIFNLNDDEDLTHKGKPIENIQKFEMHVSDSDDEDGLDDKFVTRAHFGDLNSEMQSAVPKTHKEIIEDLIRDTKQKKQELRIEREFNADLTEKLDKDWKDLHTLMSGLRTGTKPDDISNKKDPYDVIAQELKFEMRTTPAAKIKTAEELAQEEEEKIIKLENERLLRMTDNIMVLKAKEASEHLSADSIFDDFDLQPVPVDENDFVADDFTNDNFVVENVDGGSSDEDYDSDKDINKTIKNDELGKNSMHVSDTDIDIPIDLNELCNKSTRDNFFDVVNDILEKNIKTKSDKILNKLEGLFGILLQYSMEIDMSANILPHLHSIAEITSIATAKKILDVLDQEQKLFEDCKDKKSKNFPRLQTLLILKHVSALYSTSDFHHPVMTPAVIFMCNILSHRFNFTMNNAIIRLFISNILLDCVSLSKRFVPEAIVYLTKLLEFAIPNENKCNIKKIKFSLILSSKASNGKIQNLDLCELKKYALNDSTKLSIISECIEQVYHFSELYGNLSSFVDIFSNLLVISKKLPLELYPLHLKSKIQKFIDEVSNGLFPLTMLKFHDSKPKPLKLFEPRFISEFGKQDLIVKKRKLLSDVGRKIKKEEKGMLREMRRDAHMIASERLKEKMEADDERKRKVKQIYHDLAVQESEFKKLKRKK